VLTLYKKDSLNKLISNNDRLSQLGWLHTIIRKNQLPDSVALAAWVPDKFGNFYLVTSHKIANNLATTEAREKNKHRLEILSVLDIF
jgi:hypothetical protein